VCKAVQTTKCVTKKCGEWVDECYTKPGRCYTHWVECCDCCFDPCTCKTITTRHKCRVTCQEPPQTCTRKVWRERCVTEQVPCTTYVQECVTEKVPYTVRRTVTEMVKKQIPYSTSRTVRGAYVDEKGVAHESDAAGRKFQECAVVRKQVPYTVTRMVNEVVKKQVPYTTTRCARGAYVDAKDSGKAGAQGYD